MGSKNSRKDRAPGAGAGRRKPGQAPTLVRQLKADPKNARKHGERNLETISASLREVGAARSVVIDELGVVLAGNATVKAAKGAGITKVRVVDADGSELIAVRRSGLSKIEKARLALADNRSSEFADWDPARLEELLASGVTLDGLWTEDIDSRDGTGDTTHGTQKPVECMARAMRNHLTKAVYDPFHGSGTSTIAAEMLGRVCLGIDIDPVYVQQAIDRWEAFTGLKARKVS